MRGVTYVCCFVSLAFGCADNDTRSACPAFPSGVQEPVIVESTFHRIAGVVEMRNAVVDASGVYWFDRGGTLYGLPRDGDGIPQVLRVAPAVEFYAMGMISDGAALYWAEAADTPQLTEPGPPSPPWRLFSIEKTGGDPRLLLEAPDYYVRPLAALDDRVIVVRSGTESALLSVAKDGSGHEPIAPNVPAQQAQIIEGKLYWFVEGADSNDVNGYYQDLWRAKVDGSEAEYITRIDGGDFLAGDDFILWRQERVHLDPLVLDQNYVMLDERSGCVTRLPARGETIGSGSVKDATHVYWKSFNGLDGVSSSDPALPVTPLIRVDLRSGAIEQVVTPGFELTLGTDLVGQTADELYFRVENGELVAIDKP